MVQVHNESSVVLRPDWKEKTCSFKVAQIFHLPLRVWRIAYVVCKYLQIHKSCLGWENKPRTFFVFSYVNVNKYKCLFSWRRSKCYYSMSSWHTATCTRHPDYAAIMYGTVPYIRAHGTSGTIWSYYTFSPELVDCLIWPHAPLHLFPTFLSLLSQVYKVCWSLSREPSEDQVTHRFLGLWTGGRTHGMSALVECCMTSLNIGLSAFLNTFFFS